MEILLFQITWKYKLWKIMNFQLKLDQLRAKHLGNFKNKFAKVVCKFSIAMSTSIL
jgi:hypothetical protein